jgi:hypothetical protein
LGWPAPRLSAWSFSQPCLHYADGGPVTGVAGIEARRRTVTGMRVGTGPRQMVTCAGTGGGTRLTATRSLQSKPRMPSPPPSSPHTVTDGKHRLVNRATDISSTAPKQTSSRTSSLLHTPGCPRVLPTLPASIMMHLQHAAYTTHIQATLNRSSCIDGT